MAQKRMFDKKVVGSDKFLDLPNSSKALYFMAGMEADDKGFFQPRKIQRMCGFSDDDYKILIAKGFFITFDSGVMVVTDWNKNNWLDSRRVSETEYIDELNMLKLINQRYEFVLENNNAKRMLSEYSIEENSIDKNSIVYICSNSAKENTNDSAKNTEAFEQFWKAYPKKVSKQKCIKWFEKNKPSEQLLDTMLKQIERFKQTKEWQKDNGQYIPYPITWLNGKRWEDEFETECENEEAMIKRLEEKYKDDNTGNK